MSVPSDVAEEWILALKPEFNTLHVVLSHVSRSEKVWSTLVRSQLPAPLPLGLCAVGR